MFVSMLFPFLNPILAGANTQDKDEIVFVSKDDEDVIDAEVKTGIPG